MPKPPKSETKLKPAEADVFPDAWERFEKAVDVALHTKPKHKPTKKISGPHKRKGKS